jgi:hypothetical protein
MRMAHVLSSLLTVILVAAGAVGQTIKCTCGPDFCPIDPRYPAKLAAKKASMVKHGYPTDLIALMDRDGACVARVERAPDGFSLKLVKSDGSSSTIVWTQDDETLARKELLNGTLKAYYKFNVSRALSCCEEPRYDKRSDWDASLELNLKLVIVCSKDGNSVTCKPGQ